ncbi:MAG: AMP-binding protein [Flammeovirgaceae bacterium]
MATTLPQSAFEQHLISFWNEWQGGQEEFELKTSGSTGTPKKITVQRSQLIASARMTLAALGLRQKDTALICLDSRYIAGRMMLVRSWVGDMNMVALEPTANPFQALANESIDFVALVPYQLKTILNAPEKKWFNQIKHVIVGGAPLNEGTKKLLQPFSAQFYETFGMTETLSHVALKKVNGPERSDYFHVLPGVRIWQDERACLGIEAPHLPTEIITNDVVEMKSLEEFIWLGRVDNVINSGGIKVFPESTERKIEQIFAELKLTNRYFVAGIPDEKWGQRVALIIEGKLPQAVQGQLEYLLKKRLSKFEIPRSVECIAQFAETATGKLDRIKSMANLP